MQENVLKARILFNGVEHEKAFTQIKKECRIREDDVERISLIYILTITENGRRYFDMFYDRKNDAVIPESIKMDWLTGTDRKAIRLAYNLYNGGVPTSRIKSEKTDRYYNPNIYQIDDIIWNFREILLENAEFYCNLDEIQESTPCRIFNFEMAKYFVQGIMLRFNVRGIIADN